MGLQFRYYRVISKALLGFSVPDKQPGMTAHKALLGFSVPDKQPSMTAHYIPCNPNPLT